MNKLYFIKQYWGAYLISPFIGVAIFLVHGGLFNDAENFSRTTFFDIMFLIFFSIACIAPILLIFFTPVLLFLEKITTKNRFIFSSFASVLMGFVLSTIWLVRFKRFTFSLDLIFRGWNGYLYFGIVGLVFSMLWTRSRKKQLLLVRGNKKEKHVSVFKEEKK